jgi:AGZA family xanthine/uracil permease-like MFS transporter
MLQGVGDIDWSKPTWSIPAGLTMLVMPLTMNPAYGLIAGMISFPVVKTAAGEYSQVRPGQIAIAALCVVYFYVELGGVLG